MSIDLPFSILKISTMHFLRASACHGCHGFRLTFCWFSASKSPSQPCRSKSMLQQGGAFATAHPATVMICDIKGCKFQHKSSKSLIHAIYLVFILGIAQFTTFEEVSCFQLGHIPVQRSSMSWAPLCCSTERKRCLPEHQVPGLDNMVKHDNMALAQC